MKNKDLSPYQEARRIQKHSMVALDQSLAARPLSERPAMIGDVRNLQEMLGISLKDLYYLTAFTAREIPLSSKYANVRLDSIGKRVQLTLLVRLLTDCLEASPLLPEPDMQEAIPVIRRILIAEVPELMESGEVSWGKVSMCFGTTDWSGHHWSAGAARSPMVQRLFLSLIKAIRTLGEERAADLYREVLNAEARARGFTGLAEVIRTKSWHRKPVRKSVKPVKSEAKPAKSAAKSAKPAARSAKPSAGKTVRGKGKSAAHQTG